MKKFIIALVVAIMPFFLIMVTSRKLQGNDEPLTITAVMSYLKTFPQLEESLDTILEMTEEVDKFKQYGENQRLPHLNDIQQGVDGDFTLAQFWERVKEFFGYAYSFMSMVINLLVLLVELVLSFLMDMATIITWVFGMLKI